MDVPLWLAAVLRSQNFVQLQLPRTFSKRLRESLKADPSAVRLRDKSPHFYEVGLRMADLVPTEDTVDLPTDIQATLSMRVRDVLEFAPNTLGRDVSAYRAGLTDTETQLFDASRAYAALRMRWRRRLEEDLGDAASLTPARVLATASMPLSRGQKRARSLLATGTT
jgi:GINS complex subunit 3